MNFPWFFGRIFSAAPQAECLRGAGQLHVFFFVTHVQGLGFGVLCLDGMLFDFPVFQEHSQLHI